MYKRQGLGGGKTTFVTVDEVASAHMKELAAVYPVLNEDKAKEADARFCKFIESVFDKRIVSSVFLTGEGFENNWYPNALRVLCNGPVSYTHLSRDHWNKYDPGGTFGRNRGVRVFGRCIRCKIHVSSGSGNEYRRTCGRDYVCVFECTYCMGGFFYRCNDFCIVRIGSENRKMCIRDSCWIGKAFEGI